MYASLPRGGMQVHAVPEQERFVDSTGRKLPWAYERADFDPTTRREPAEKGPFGRSMRRRGTSRSRSKTAEPRKEEDKIRLENMAAEDAIFGRLKQEQREKDLPKGGALQAAEVPGAGSQDVKVPTEVILYGFGDELQWSAIDFYERVSNGVVLEDYEREAPGHRPNMARSMSRATAQRTLTKASLRRKNTFHGGKHWIKVTFDSIEAADLACARSPHVLKGHLVYAEPYRGTGPSKDEPIFSSTAGAQITSDALPATFSTHPNVEASPQSSETVSSATVKGPAFGSQLPPKLGGLFNPPAQSLQQSRSTALESRPSQSSVQLQPRLTRIPGATRAVLLPAEQAMLPKQPKKSWTAWLGTGEIIGSTVPCKEDGKFDYDRASFYWRLFFFLDWLLGTDFCGLRRDD